MHGPQARGPARGSTWFGLVAGSLGLTLLALLALAKVQEPGTLAAMARKRQVVETFGLTDLSLFTDARYTRHPTQTDLTTPFQDHPVSLERFPSGMVMPLPQREPAAMPGGAR
ncbi:MAG TPA: hypothetical protein VK997_04480 [Deferrisomatales bacterium]|nr:hypothetical protein [Deferrisomatales bacterium]